MATVPCPGCRTDLDPAATVCPICLRPRTKLEITRAFSTLREMENQRKKRPFIIAGRLLAAAAIGGALYRFQGPVLGALSSASVIASKTMNDLLYPPPPPKAAAAQLAPAAETPSVPPHGSAFAAASASSPRPAASPAAPPAAANPNAPPSPAKRRRTGKVEDLPLPAFDPATQWVFYGRLFDLITLQPVDNAQLDINAFNGLQRTGTDLYPRTDDEGRFAAVLRRLPEGNSYEIRATRAGYATSVLYESDIPYATLPLSDRREMVRNAQDGDMTLPPLTDAGEASVRRDIFLAPAR